MLPFRRFDAHSRALWGGLVLVAQRSALYPFRGAGCACQRCTLSMDFLKCDQIALNPTKLNVSRAQDHSVPCNYHTQHFGLMISNH